MSHQLDVVRRFSAFITIGIHQELRVTVEGEESPDVSVILNKVDDRFNLHLWVGTGPTVRVRTGITAGSRTCRCKRRNKGKPVRTGIHERSKQTNTKPGFPKNRSSAKGKALNADKCSNSSDRAWILKGRTSRWYRLLPSSCAHWQLVNEKLSLQKTAPILLDHFPSESLILLRQLLILCNRIWEHERELSS